MFRTNQPVTRGAFYDRDAELDRLSGLAEALREGAPQWLAILGARKIGKSSLLLETSRRAAHPDLRFVLIDATEGVPISAEFFRRYALRTLDAAWSEDLGASLEVLAAPPGGYLTAVTGIPAMSELDRGLRSLILELPRLTFDPAVIRHFLDLPESLSTILGCRFIVAIDEFQELGLLNGQRHRVEPFSVMRSVWQKHQRTAYVISGSGRSMLRALIASKTSPFFQHFDVLELGPLPEPEAIRLLTEASPVERRIPRAMAQEVVAVVGTHPFYVQLIGEAMTRREPPYNTEVLKGVLQDQLFSRSGRLSLYFQMEFDRLVGRSTYLAAVLNTLAGGPARLGDIARAIGSQPGHASGYIERLGDAVLKRPDGQYQLDDPTFALWLRWRQPGGSALPMTLIGDEAEREVATLLAKAGFELVYQARASRGAFDILATRGAHQLGIQVKRSPLPLRFQRREWNRMEADARRFGWRWLIASVGQEGSVTFLDPAKGRKGKEVRLTTEAKVENILSWLGRTGEPT